MEDLLLERSPKFWEMIARARKGKAVSIETLQGELKGPGKPARQARTRTGKTAKAGSGGRPATRRTV
jgi:hypothetical protein